MALFGATIRDEKARSARPAARYFQGSRLKEAALIWQGNCLLGIQSDL